MECPVLNAMNTSAGKVPAIAALAPLPSALAAVLVRANAIAHMSKSSATLQMLQGKNIGLVSKTGEDADARLFFEAASGLGAKVSLVWPNLSDDSSETEVAGTARMLGRLYDAIECQGVSPELVERVGRSAGVPVFGGIASSSHPTAVLACAVEGSPSPTEGRRYVVQALLLVAMT
jgi:ornithine carbamoyltransferase